MFKKKFRSKSSEASRLLEKKQADSLHQAILERNSAEVAPVEEEKERKLEEKRAARQALRQKRREEKKKQRKGRRHWYGVPVGLVVLIFAVIGIFSSARWVYTWAHDYLTDDSAARAYDEYLYPVVILDPKPFETIDGADNAMMLQAAIWKTMLDDLPNMTPETDDHARILFPAIMVEENAVALFGTQCILTPVDIPLQTDLPSEGEDAENPAPSPSTTIQYDAEKDVYCVPTNSISSYQPYVKKITRTMNNKKILIVGYYTMINSAHPTDENPYTEDRFVKDMEYHISYDSDTQQEYISAIRVVED